ncbi:hypothetical protein HYPSUDRAFT_998751 [Hypholoma sublateritium FD-334 SS-4]|uniref:Uncharacterized protein n=1 Tax=Hypholoma sublateritium (strain FD-334 SS-4) TaxID=945553 RepID=A0A0D2NFV1_HYPSF|nr:hypothetical protein HYPSUDRAFT_998751 [Hypholoma sublateritium FD-334 SS-4]
MRWNRAPQPPQRRAPPRSLTPLPTSFRVRVRVLHAGPTVTKHRTPFPHPHPSLPPRRDRAAGPSRARRTSDVHRFAVRVLLLRWACHYCCALYITARPERARAGPERLLGLAPGSVGGVQGRGQGAEDKEEDRAAGARRWRIVDMWHDAQRTHARSRRPCTAARRVPACTGRRRIAVQPGAPTQRAPNHPPPARPFAFHPPCPVTSCHLRPGAPTRTAPRASNAPSALINYFLWASVTTSIDRRHSKVRLGYGMLLGRRGAAGSSSERVLREGKVG